MTRKYHDNITKVYIGKHFDSNHETNTAKLFMYQLYLFPIYVAITVELPIYGVTLCTSCFTVLFRKDLPRLTLTRQKQNAECCYRRLLLLFGSLLVEHCTTWMVSTFT